MYFVTGARGNVGRDVAAQLLGCGEEVRIFARDPSKVTLSRDRKHAAVGNYNEPHRSDSLVLLVSRSRAVRAGKAATSTDAVQKILGRVPTTFEAWARKNAARFA